MFEHPEYDFWHRLPSCQSLLFMMFVSIRFLLFILYTQRHLLPPSETHSVSTFHFLFRTPAFAFTMKRRPAVYRLTRKTARQRIVLALGCSAMRSVTSFGLLRDHTVLQLAKEAVQGDRLAQRGASLPCSGSAHHLAACANMSLVVKN